MIEDGVSHGQQKRSIRIDMPGCAGYPGALVLRGRSAFADRCQVDDELLLPVEV